jgi:hypothetical protein
MLERRGRWGVEYLQTALDDFLRLLGGSVSVFGDSASVDGIDGVSARGDFGDIVEPWCGGVCAGVGGFV